MTEFTDAYTRYYAPWIRNCTPWFHADAWNYYAMANFWLQETIYYIYLIQRDLLLNMLWYHHKNIHPCKYIARQSYGTTLRGQPFCLTTGGNVSQCQYKDLPIFKRALETLWETFMVEPLQWRDRWIPRTKASNAEMFPFDDVIMITFVLSWSAFFLSVADFPNYVVWCICVDNI